jgi:hypothetical protein
MVAVKRAEFAAHQRPPYRPATWPELK